MSGKRASGILVLVGCLAALLSLAPHAMTQGAPSVSVSTSSDSASEPTVTFTVTVDGLDEETKWKNIHFWPKRKKSFPKRKGSTNVTVTPDGGERARLGRPGTTREVESTSGRTTKTASGNGTYEFELQFKSGGTDTKMKWEATKTGNEYPSQNEEIDEGNGAGTEPDAPQAAVTANEDDPISIGINIITSIPVRTEPEFEGQAYEVFTSLSLNPNFEDTLALGINSDTDPVPAVWGLNYFDFEGTIDSEGTASPSPSIQVPNDPGLVDEESYLVFAVKEGGEIAYSSAPILVTITE